MELNSLQKRYLDDLVVDISHISQLADKFFDTNDVISRLNVFTYKEKRHEVTMLGWTYAASIVHKKMKMKAMTNLAQQLVDYIEKEDPYGTKQSS